MGLIWIRCVKIKSWIQDWYNVHGEMSNMLDCYSSPIHFVGPTGSTFIQVVRLDTNDKILNFDSMILTIESRTSKMNGRTKLFYSIWFISEVPWWDGYCDHKKKSGFFLGSHDLSIKHGYELAKVGSARRVGLSKTEGGMCKNYKVNGWW